MNSEPTLFRRKNPRSNNSPVLVSVVYMSLLVLIAAHSEKSSPCFIDLHNPQYKSRRSVSHSL